MDKKSEQLGILFGTASNRLVKDILWELIKETNRELCFHCNEEMSRETFSIEHKIPWLDSENPQELFFDFENISFSHLKCNIVEGRKRHQKPCGTETSYRKGCRCRLCKDAHAVYNKARYTKENRRQQYLRTGK